MDVNSEENHLVHANIRIVSVIGLHVPWRKLTFWRDICNSSEAKYKKLLMPPFIYHTDLCSSQHWLLYVLKHCAGYTYSNACGSIAICWKRYACAAILKHLWMGSALHIARCFCRYWVFLKYDIWHWTQKPLCGINRTKKRSTNEMKTHIFKQGKRCFCECLTEGTTFLRQRVGASSKRIMGNNSGYWSGGSFEIFHDKLRNNT